MNVSEQSKGFTIIELMIVVVIVAILMALAIPNYTRYVRKANRGEAQTLLLNWANNQEIWRANDTDYAAEGAPNGIPAPMHDKYNLFVRVTASDPPAAGDCGNVAPSATQYTLVACATGDQVKDEDRGVSCTWLTLDQANDKKPPECW